MQYVLSFKREFVISFILLAVAVVIVQFFGLRSIRRGDITFDIADSCNYLNVAQYNYSGTSGITEHLWEALHSYKSNILKQKAPGTQLAAVPVVRMMKGAYVDVLRQYSFIWIIPSVFLLTFALSMIVRPFSALLGALFFLLSQTTIMTFSHFFQEMTAIPAVCMALAVFIFEIKNGASKSLSWLPSGLLLGLGMYTKVSYVFIFVWMWLSLFILSGALLEPSIRRKRLFFEGVTAYCVSSFWWPTHFLHVLKYTQTSFNKHGVMTDASLERVFLFFRSDFIYMYGVWLAVILFVLVGLALLQHRRFVFAYLRFSKDDKISFVCLCLVVLLFISLFFTRFRGVANNASLFTLIGLLLILISRLRKIMQGTIGYKLATLIIIGVPLLASWFQRLNGNNFNPRIYSVFIPLTAILVAILFDVVHRANMNRRFVFASLPAALIILGLIFHVLALAGYGIATKQTENHRFITPFKAVCTLADLSALPSAAPLPQDGRLSIGFVGNGNISPHLIKYAYSPYSARVDPVHLFGFPARFETAVEKTVEDLVESALDVDYVLIPKVDHAVFISPCSPLDGFLINKENQMNYEFASMLRNDPRFKLVVDTPNIRGKTDGIVVFQVNR